MSLHLLVPRRSPGASATAGRPGFRGRGPGYSCGSAPDSHRLRRLPPGIRARGTAASALSCGANLRLLGRAGQGAGRSRRRSARSTLSRGRRSALRVNPQRRAPSAANIIAMRTLITSSAEHTEQKTSVRFSIDICAPPCPVAGRLFGSHSFGAAQERSTPRRRGVSQPMSSLPRDRRA